MGILEDTIGEFRKASPQEKIFIVGGGLAALAIALYIHGKSAGSTTPAQGATGAGLTGGTSSGGIQTAPSASTGNVPILPQGMQPVFDAAGNLLAWQPIAQGTPGASNAQAFLGPKPLIPFGQYTGPTYKPGVNSAANLGQYSYGGIKYNISSGGPLGQDIWGTPSTGGDKIMLYNTANQYYGSQYYTRTPPQAPVPQGGGPYGTSVLGVHRSRLAPTQPGLRQPSQIARVYAMRGQRQ